MACVENPNFPIGEIGESASVELELSDSDVCGKRKRGREIPESTKIDSGGCGGSAMENPKEKPKKSREVSKFEDTYEIFDPFKEKMIFEREDFDPLRDYFSSDDDEVEEVKRSPFDREAVLKYISQVRNSFAFDLDVHLPGWLVGLLYFMPLNLSHRFNRDYAYKRANFAIDEINADMNRKTYELVEVVNAVDTHPCYSLMFLTLTAKKVGEAEVEAAVSTIQAIVFHPIHGHGSQELHQWMVKPETRVQEA